MVCTGSYQREHRPGFIEEIAREVPVVGAAEYRAPDSLPGGTVLVIGGGQSGCQIAHELAHAGREVVLAAGTAPAMPRRVDGRDIVDWDAARFDRNIRSIFAELAAATPPLLGDLGVVVNAVGFRPDYSWIAMQGIVDDMGFPLQEDGASTRVPGLSVVGVPWMRTRKSPLLLGVGEDADVVVRRLAGR
ncbi:hypothetical protein ASE14_07900 [Agromyces sp. Root81]|nr:hypothetical protein ASE14_07900 [Agromyces sp. Root81]